MSRFKMYTHNFIKWAMNSWLGEIQAYFIIVNELLSDIVFTVSSKQYNHPQKYIRRLVSYKLLNQNDKKFYRDISDKLYVFSLTDFKAWFLGNTATGNTLCNVQRDIIIMPSSNVSPQKEIVVDGLSQCLPYIILQYIKNLREHFIILSSRDFKVVVKLLKDYIVSCMYTRCIELENR